MELKKNLDTYQVQITELRNENNHLKEELGEKSSMNKKLMNDNSQLYKSIEQRNLELVQLKAQVDGMNNSLDNTKGEKENLNSKNSHLIECLNSLRSEYDQIIQENQELNRAVAERDSKIRLFETERIKLMNKIEEASFEKQNLYGKIRVSEESIISIQKHNQEIMKENISHQGKITELEIALEKHKSEINQINQSLISERNLKSQNESTLDSLDKMIAEKNKEISNLKSEIDNMNSMLEKTTKSLNQFQAESERLKSHIIVITEQNQDLFNQIKDINSHDSVIMNFLNRKERLFNLLDNSKAQIDLSLTNLENYSKSVGRRNYDYMESKEPEKSFYKDRENKQRGDFRYPNSTRTLQNNSFNN